MKSPAYKNILYRLSEDLRDWFIAALKHYELRSDDDIEHVVIQQYKKNSSNGLSENELFITWDIYKDESIDWIDDPESFQKALIVNIQPTLTVPEYALVLGLIYSYEATHQLNTRSHTNHLNGALLYSCALEAKDYWSSTRGLDRCRAPNKTIIKANNTLKKTEFNPWFEETLKEIRKKSSQTATNARYDQPGGYREKKKKILEIWASGKYSSKDECAENEYETLCISKRTARNYLINAPIPNRN